MITLSRQFMNAAWCLPALRLKAAIRSVLLISKAAVKTEAAPINNAPFLNTPSNLKKLI